MEEPSEEWEIEEEEHESGDSKMSWILNKGWGIGKKMMITGAVISSAPVVLPPLLIFSTIGFAFSVPFGLYFASYACTDKLMSKLLSTPSPVPSQDDDTFVFPDSEIEEEEEQILKDYRDQRKEKVTSEEDQLDQKYKQEGGEIEEDYQVEPVEERKGEMEGTKREKMSDSAEKKEDEEVKPVEDELIREVGQERIDDQSTSTNLTEEKETELEDSVEEEEEPRRESNGVRVESRGVEGTNETKKEEEKPVNQNLGNTQKEEGLVRDANGMKEVSDEDGQNVEANNNIEEGEKPREKIENEVEISIDEEDNNIVDDKGKPIIEVAIDDIEEEEKFEGKDEGTVLRKTRNKEYVNETKEEEDVEEIEAVVLSSYEGKEKDVGDTKEERAIPVQGQVDEAAENNNGSPTVDEEAVRATPEKDNIREIAVESGLDLVDEEVTGTNESHEVKESQATTGDDVKGAPANDKSISSKEVVVVYTEEKTWEQIDALRKIVGYKASAQEESCMEEVKALYVFTGVEPPSAFKDPSDLVEVNNKLRLLMSIVGVK